MRAATVWLGALRVCDEFRDVVHGRFGAGRNRSRTAHLKQPGCSIWL